MKPYYEDGSVTIYHGDALEILPSIEADVLLTDPPYGTQFSKLNPKGGIRSQAERWAWTRRVHDRQRFHHRRSR